LAQLADPDLLVAAAVHPFFRLSWVKDDIERAAIISMVKGRVLALERSAGEATSEVEATPAAAPKKAGEKRSSAFFSRLQEQSKRPKTGTEQEVEQYLLAEPDDDLKSLKNRFLRLLYVETNTALPSSAAVERLFSLGGRVFVPFRSSLSDEHFEQLVFLRANWAVLDLDTL
jgi:hypothetical protein